MTRTIAAGGAVALALVLLDPAPCSAQDRYQDATAASYALASLELTLVGTALMHAAVDPSGIENLGMLLLDIFLVIAVPTVTSIVAGVTGAPAEVPLVWHGALGGFASLGGLGAGIGLLAGGQEAGALGLILGGTAGLIAGAVWAGFRAGDLTHDPQRLGPAHLLTWAPVPAALLALAVVVAASDGDEVGLAALLAGVVATAFTVAAVAWSESLPAPVATTSEMVSIRF